MRRFALFTFLLLIASSALHAQGMGVLRGLQIGMSHAELRALVDSTAWEYAVPDDSMAIKDYYVLSPSVAAASAPLNANAFIGIGCDGSTPCATLGPAALFFTGDTLSRILFLLPTAYSATGTDSIVAVANTAMRSLEYQLGPTEPPGFPLKAVTAKNIIAMEPLSSGEIGRWSVNGLNYTHGVMRFGLGRQDMASWTYTITVERQ